MSSDSATTTGLASAIAVFVIDAGGIVTFAEGGFDGFDFTDAFKRKSHVTELFRPWPAVVEGIQDAMAGSASRLDLLAGDRTFELNFQPRMNGGVLLAAVDATRHQDAERNL